jgi:hypothetical protein
MMECKFARCPFLFAAMLVAAATSARASVEISSKPTHNMSCVGGVCTPTAKNATLNVDDLAGMLSTGDVTVTTKKKGPSIALSASLTWTSAHRLTLDARRDVSIDAPIVVGGPGGVTIMTDNNGFGGDWALGHRASITFQDLGGSLVINGKTYALVGDLASLAAAIAQNPSGQYALADNYDASADGTYTSWPVETTFTGAFSGLGHAIDKLKISGQGLPGIALFFETEEGTTMIRDLGVTNADFTAVGTGDAQGTGIIVGEGLGGKILQCWTTGNLTLKKDKQSYVGGLVGYNGDTIMLSWSSVRIKASHSTVGGLAGTNESFFGFVDQSYFHGSVTGAKAGGLVGDDEGSTSHGYAMGSVTGTSAASGVSAIYGNQNVNHSLEQTYSTALTTVGSGGVLGGVIGSDLDSGDSGIVENYWDLDTTGVSDPSQGAGNKPNDPGLTGLSDAQLKSALPSGFDPNVWGQSVSINNGYPYLLANPPQ